MTATYYVDPTASGDDDGTTEANAWTSLQRAIDGTDGTQPGIDDTILCKHTGDEGVADETLTVKIDVDGNTGHITDGTINYIGVNSSWVNDGTQYVIDANSTAVNCLDFTIATTDWIWFKNFIFKKATSHGVNFNVSGPYYNNFSNCRFTLNGGDGLYAYKNAAGICIFCCFDNNVNGSNAVYNAQDLWFCCARDNTNNGGRGKLYVYHSMFFDNGAHGIKQEQTSGGCYNSAIDNNTDGGIFVSGDYYKSLFNRFTNHSETDAFGIDAGNEHMYMGWNYFENNDGDNIKNGGACKELGANQFDQGDTDAGYKSLTEGAENYELDPTATMFETEIQIPTGQ